MTHFVTKAMLIRNVDGKCHIKGIEKFVAIVVYEIIYLHFT